MVGERRSGSSATEYGERVRTASMLALPHSPHDDEVKKFRAALESTGVTPDASSTSSTLYCCGSGVQ